MRIEDATDDDLPAVVAIYNDVIRTSTAIYREEPATLDERQAWNETRKTNGYPLLVARTDDGSVAGFATFGDFRAWPGYRFTVEHSVHVADGQRGLGIGTALMRVLLERGGRLRQARDGGRHRRRQRRLDPHARAPRLRADRSPQTGRLEIRALARSRLHAAPAVKSARPACGDGRLEPANTGLTSGWAANHTRRVPCEFRGQRPVSA